jgi:hypothetical protein
MTGVKTGLSLRQPSLAKPDKKTKTAGMSPAVSGASLKIKLPAEARLPAAAFKLITAWS